MADGTEHERLTRVVSSNPVEGLRLELKSWIDPDVKEDQVKIIKSCIALYNEDGGDLIIGIDDKTLLPANDYPGESWVIRKYNSDNIQKLISMYSSRAIYIYISFIKHSARDTLHPVITIKNGVEALAISSKEIAITDANKKTVLLMPRDKVYVRTLDKNHSVSTAEPGKNDWDRVIRNCLDNREADIAKFISRHLTPDQIDILKKEFSQMDASSVDADDTFIPYVPGPDPVSLLDNGYDKFSYAREKRRGGNGNS